MSFRSRVIVILSFHITLYNGLQRNGHAMTHRVAGSPLRPLLSADKIKKPLKPPNSNFLSVFVTAAKTPERSGLAMEGSGEGLPKTPERSGLASFNLLSYMIF